RGCRRAWAARAPGGTRAHRRRRPRRRRRRRGEASALVSCAPFRVCSCRCFFKVEKVVAQCKGIAQRAGCERSLLEEEGEERALTRLARGAAARSSTSPRGRGGRTEARREERSGARPSARAQGPAACAVEAGRPRRALAPAALHEGHLQQAAVESEIAPRDAAGCVVVRPRWPCDERVRERRRGVRIEFERSGAVNKQNRALDLRSRG